MKKLFLFVALIATTTTISFAQRVQERMVMLGDQNQPGYTLTFTDLDSKALSDAVDSRFQKMAGMKAGKFKGFTLYSAQPFLEFGPANYDIYTKVASEGKKGSTVSVFYLVVTEGNMNSITANANPQVVENIKNFMDKFVNYARANNSQNKIIELNGTLSKEQKNLEKLQSKYQKTLDGVNSLQKEIDASKENIQNLQSQINQNNSLLQQFQK